MSQDTNQMGYIEMDDRAKSPTSTLRKRVSVAIDRVIMYIVNEANDTPNHAIRAALAGLIANPLSKTGGVNPAYNLAVDRFTSMLSHTVDLFVGKDTDGNPVPLNLDLEIDNDLFNAVLSYWDLAAKVAVLDQPTSTGV